MKITEKGMSRIFKQTVKSQQIFDCIKPVSPENAFKFGKVLVLKQLAKIRIYLNRMYRLDIIRI